MVKRRNLLYSLVNRRIAAKNKEVRRKLVSGEYEKIMKEYSKSITRKTRKLFIPFYLWTALLILLKMGNPYFLLPWLSTIIPYYTYRTILQS